MKRLLCVSLLVAFGVLSVPSATLAWWPDERNQDRKEKERGDKEANDNKGQKQADREGRGPDRDRDLPDEPLFDDSTADASSIGRSVVDREPEYDASSR